MSTFAQTSDGDLLLTKGQLTVLHGAAAAAVELRNKFLFVKGEFFLDTRQGVPYFTYVFIKAPDLALIKSLFTKIILSVQGMTSVDALNLDFDRATRTLNFDFRATYLDGSVITGGSGQPFIVEP